MEQEVRLNLHQQKISKANPDLVFQFRLARDLRMTVGELRTKMSSLEYSQWATFYYVEQQERDKQRAMAEAEAKKKKMR